MSRMRFVFLVSVVIPGTMFAGGSATGEVHEGMTIQILADSAAIDSAQIVAPRPPISKGASNVVYSVDQEFFTNFPARGVDPAILLQPGVMVQGTNAFGEPLIAVREGREGEIGYRIEGVAVNDIIWGGRAVAVTPEAVEQIQVHAGGPAAEYGGGGAGVVGLQLRTGRGDRWGGSLIAETDRYTGMNNRSLDGYSYGYSDWTGTAGGPFPGLGNALRLFGSVQNTFYRDPTVSVRSGYNFSGANAVVTDPVVAPYHSVARPDTLNIVSPGGNAPGGGDNRWVMTGTALLDLSPVQLRVAGSYSYDRSQTPAGLENLLNQSRLPLSIEKDGFVNARLTHVVSPSFSYEASFSFTGKTFVTEDPQLLDNLFAYGDPAANAALGYPLHIVIGRDSPIIFNWPAYQIWGGALAINQPGAQIAGYEKTSQESFAGRAGVTLRAKNHEIRIGGECTKYTTRDFAPSNVFYWWTLRNNYMDFRPLELRLAPYSSGSSWGYDVYGREINGDDFRDGTLYSLGPRKPVIWAAYAQDRIDLQWLELTLGLRYDFIDPGSKDIADPANIQFSANGLLLASQLVDKEAYSQLSPRIGVSIPISDRSLLHAQFGRFIQETNAAGSALEPARITQYEAGFSCQLSDLVSFDVTGFYKDITHQLSIIKNPEFLTPTGYPIFQLSRSTSKYQFVSNGDAVTPKGLEVAFTLRRTNRLAAQVNYTLQDVNTDWIASLNSAPTPGGGPIYATRQYQFGVDLNAVHRGSVLLDYRFGNDDGGAILEQAGLSLLLTFNSGHAVTRFEPVYSSATPWFAELDGRLDKSFTVGPLGLDVYVYALNLLGTDNAVNVFPRTGDPSSDGYFSTPAGSMVAAQYGPQYVAFYHAVNDGKNSGNWGPPRQVRFGLRVDV